jgi:hypothetical protein
MRKLKFAGLACLVLALVACGGGGSEPTSTTSEVALDRTVIKGTTARFGAETVDFGTVTVGVTARRQVELFNDGVSAADFSAMENLASGFTASGCSAVPAGGSCSLTVAIRATSVGNKASPGVFPARADAVTNRLSMTAVAEPVECAPSNSGPKPTICR